MNILLLGSGGREHALAWKVAQSPRVTEVHVAPGNAGTAGEPRVQNVPVAADDVQGLVEHARAARIDLTIVGPEGPLVRGVTDAFAAAGLRCFGPSAAAARLEGSKAYMKEFLRRHAIPTAAYATFTRASFDPAWVRAQRAPLVVKADGLAAGKGVVICATVDEAVETAESMFAGRFGAAGDTEAGLFFGQAAVAMGLADAVGTFDDALAQLLASLSPNPTPVAAATRAGPLCNHPMESSMNERSDPAALDRPAADPAGSLSQPPAAATLNVSDAIEIAQTCTLAGRADLIAGFLETNTAPATVRSRLLAAKADASPEIVSRIAPDAARTAPANPLIDAARNLAAQSSAMKKEI